MDDKRELVRRFLAAFACRTQKALRDAPANCGCFGAGNGVRTPVQLVRHITGVLAYARTFFVGGTYWPDPLPSLQEKVKRFHEMVQDLARHIADGSPLLERISTERLLQAPLSDVMTHAGQLAMLPRLAGAPVAPENFVFADISPERLGRDQAEPASPDAVWRGASGLATAEEVTDNSGLTPGQHAAAPVGRASVKRPWVGRRRLPDTTTERAIDPRIGAAHGEERFAEAAG